MLLIIGGSVNGFKVLANALVCVLGHVATWREVGEVQSVPIGTSSHNSL